MSMSNQFYYLLCQETIAVARNKIGSSAWVELFSREFIAPNDNMYVKLVILDSK